MTDVIDETTEDDGHLDLNGLLAKAQENYAAMSANPEHRGPVDETFSAFVISIVEDTEQQIVTEALERVEPEQHGPYHRRRVAFQVLNDEFAG